MSTLWWAGVGIDPATQGADAARELDDQVEDMIVGLDAEPFSTILEPDGSEIHRYLFGSHVVSDIRDRLGNRIGFGIECSDEESARSCLAPMQTLLVHWEVDALASIWTWSRMETRHPAPVGLSPV